MQKSIAAFLFLTFCTTQALSGPLDPLAADTTAILHGSTPFLSSINPFNNQQPNLVGSVDWAVYAPGTFPASFAAGGYSPTPGDYVYTYQVHEDHGAAGDGDFTHLSVDLINGPIVQNIGDFSGVNTVGLVAGVMSDAPFIFTSGSANWIFDAPPIHAGGTSDGLAFSSPNPPVLISGVVSNTVGAAELTPVPVPRLVPESGTLTLAACGFAILVLKRLLRKSSPSW
jgi:hypothetical protein